MQGEQDRADRGSCRDGSEKRAAVTKAPHPMNLGLGCRREGMKKRCVSDGSTELLKWIGLVLMTGDHINSCLFNSTLPVLFGLGRLCLPIFVFVLAYNLARPGAPRSSTNPVVARCVRMSRLRAARVPWWPLSRLVALERAFHTSGDRCSRVPGGTRWGPPVGGCACFPCGWGDGGVLVACARVGPLLLVVLQDTFGLGMAWRLALLFPVGCSQGQSLGAGRPPAQGVVTRSGFSVPRVRWRFHACYPAQLVAIALLRIPMARAGYLFA
jgi:hypothetical protein